MLCWVLTDRFRRKPWVGHCEKMLSVFDLRTAELVMADALRV